MRRERKEIYKEMERLARMEEADEAMGCGFGQLEIIEAFEPEWRKLREKLAATYGMTVEQRAQRIYECECEAYESGRIPYSPCFDMYL